jgi:hypothetical protein
LGKKKLKSRGKEVFMVETERGLTFSESRLEVLVGVGLHVKHRLRLQLLPTLLLLGRRALWF